MVRLLCGLTLAVCLSGQSKRPLTHADNDSWNTIQRPTLSRDGRYLAYGLFPQQGEGALVVRDLKTGEERREPAGALPPPQEPSPDREPDEEPPQQTIRIAWSRDSRFVVFSIFPKGVGMLDMSRADKALRVDNVKSFQAGGSTIAYLKEKPADLVVRDLPAASEQTISGVTEFALARDGKHCVYATADGVGIAGGKQILERKGKHQKFTWDVRQTQLAFLSEGKLYLWPRGADAAQELVSTATPGFRDGFVVSERGAIGFSRDGSRVFFGAGPKPVEAAKPKPDDVSAELWHYQDPYIQPMQKVRAARDRTRSYRAAFHIADRKLVQLGDESLASMVFSDDGRYALGSDDRAYRSMVDYDRLYADHYLVDTATGTRRKLIEKSDATPQMYWAPDSNRALLFRDRHWHVLDAASGLLTNATAAIPVKFFDEQNDRPMQPSSYGAAGWTRDSKWALVYDRHDVWQISADGKTIRNLTDGIGRKERLQFRVVRLQPDEEHEPRGHAPSEPLLLRAENLETRDSGFYRDRIDGQAQPQKLVMGARNYRAIGKARDAEVVAYTASRFEEYPDVRITDGEFRDSKKVTEANPQKGGLQWGTAELISFRNSDGVPLQAALYKPDGFDTKKKYPMLVYIYERLSQNVHNFVDPKPGTSPNIAYYVSNGYLVLTPDIVYTTGAPGQSALKCVLPAIEAAVARGGVDESAIGIAGHSWGGYQVSYLVTQTKRFRAAEAGAPVANMTSAYNGIRWGTGLPRQFQYERAQSRIGGSLWEYPLQFLQNSPIFHVTNVDTPLLLLHNDQDDAVPWYQGIEMYLALRRHGKESYLFNYNGEKHGIRKRPNQQDWTIRMQQFFDHHLKGAAKPQWMVTGYLT